MKYEKSETRAVCDGAEKIAATALKNGASVGPS